MRTALQALLVAVGLFAGACSGDEDSSQRASSVVPSSSVTPSGTGWARSGLSEREVANVEWADGALYISRADGSDRIKVSDQVCGWGPESSVTIELSWSPQADRIAAICMGDFPQAIEIHHRAGLPVTVIPAIGLPATEPHSSRGMTLLAWSPDGTRIAFQTLNRTEPPVAHVTLADVLTGEMESLSFEAVLLPSGWARPNEILLGLNPGNPVRDDPYGYVVFSEYDAPHGTTSRQA